MRAERCAQTCKSLTAHSAGRVLTCNEFMIPIWQSPMTSLWAVLEMQCILGNLLRYATRILRPNISSQLSRWRLQKATLNDSELMFEDGASVARDRKPLSQVIDERACWNCKLYGGEKTDQPANLKRAASGTEDAPRKRLAHLMFGIPE